MSTYTVRGKKPSEALDYDFDFGTRWMPSGDSLPSSTSTSLVTAETGITLGTKSHPGSNVVKIYLSGGTAGTDYRVTCVITTAQGRIKEANMVVPVRNDY